MNISTKLLTQTLALLLTLHLASAITASIGNSRMILYPESDEEIRRSILVKNVNDLSVDIKLIIDNSTANVVKLEEEFFSLPPNEEKKAYFTIRATSPKTEHSKIFVSFNAESENSVGLSSTITLNPNSDNPDDFAPKPVEEPSIFSNIFSQDDEEEPIASEENKANIITTITSNVAQNNDSELMLSPLIVLSITTIVLVIILASLFVYAKKKS